ncbi:hypothetical protein SAMN05444274_11722 [Mariniphaga anaerophila]|uniref:Uncharacterized protein n=1 Tax=Mariniphaga anaerophila TaxID=1484053 RepID=A0A1M5G618_9BACT|nr:hypothetical protein [Mariniphaga anaerophila]SHF99104.1 hypothetical protein SAMN05444274_11722 [Mariniphaga anaerophila]
MTIFLNRLFRGRNSQWRIVLVLIFISLSLWGNAQDLIILRDGKRIQCTITKVDNDVIHYTFMKGDRELSSYVAMSDVKSYDKKVSDDVTPAFRDSLPASETTTVFVDTTRYVKETQRWINMITYSQRLGVNATGWSVQYYGYHFRSSLRWYIPIVFGIESMTIDQEYFDRSGYQYLNMNYFNAGISPFYKLNDVFYLNLGAQIIFGEEELQDYRGQESDRSFFGIAPSQGIYFIPKSKFGVTVGISAYEKLMTSKVYKSDIGLKFELGIKF